MKNSVAPLIGTTVRVIPNGIDRMFFDARQIQGGECKRLIPVVGLAVRPSPDKGMAFLRQVVSNVNSGRKRLHFVIAGEFGWRSSVEEAFNAHGFAESVTFRGYVENVVSFYDGCDIVALTSRVRSIEGFPNSLLEAMGRGRPVIATSAGGV